MKVNNPMKEINFLKDRNSGKNNAGELQYEPPAIQFVPLKVEERLMSCAKQQFQCNQQTQNS